MLIYFSQGLLLGGAAAAQPGPFQAYLLSQTLQNGWRGTLWAAFAPLLSDGPIIFLVLFVLTRLPDGFLVSLQLVGGCFLLYLAVKAFRALRQPLISSTAPIETKRMNIFEAALMNALGPGPYIFWATIAGPILLTSWRQSAHLGLGFLFGFYGALIGGFMAFVVLFAVARQLDPRVSRVLGLASALALLGFGLYQLWQGGTAVWR
ncbi:MAG: LysE family translocator [Anaerolineae bacterium]|nr:LysE family translocator [Anaerolineae bacterium]